MESTDTVEQFKADVAAMRLKEANVSAERGWRVLGALLMILGFVLGVFAIVTDLNADLVANGVPTVTGPAEQRDAIVYALFGVMSAIVGATLFLRYSFGRFLRFWLARMIFEQDRRTG
jgi:hypothetical protein